MRTHKIGDTSSSSTNDHLATPPTFSTQMREAFADRFVLHQSLKELTSLGIGGVSDYFVRVDTTHELIKAVELAAKYDIPWRVVGGGTGLLMSDIGFPGLIVHNLASTINFTDQPGKVLVDSGCPTDRFINLSAGRGWGGVEFLAAIPGSIGGAIMTNARFEGTAIASFVREVVIARVDRNGHQLFTLPVNEIHFGVLGSSLNPATDLLVAVKLQLSKLPEEEIRRRLLLVRRQTPWRQEPRHQLGHVFEQSLTTFSDDKSLRRVKVAGLRLSRSSVDIIEASTLNLPAETVRNFLHSLQEVVRQTTGQVLKMRLNFVGYWPNQDELPS